MEPMDKIKALQAKIAVIGLGYVGLPLAVAIAKYGYYVIGIDIDQKKVKSLYERKSYVGDVSDRTLDEVIGKRMEVTFQFQPIQDADIIIICVPTLVNEAKEPDLTFVISSVDQVIKYIKKDTLIIVESTIYPGATYELVTQRIIEKKQYNVGEDFYVCFSPERVDPNNPEYGVVNTPKVIGGNTETCLEIGRLFYTNVLQHVKTVSSMEVAEVTKLLENTFRSINIGLVNEMAMMCEKIGVNVWEAIDAAATKPFGFMKFTPGPGIGGHCIPIDPLYLSWKGKQHNYYNRFIELAADINGNMPNYVVRQVQDILNQDEKSIKHSKILILGAAYKKDISDVRESPFFKVYQLLREKGADLIYHDPYVESVNLGDKVDSVVLDEKLLKEVDVVVILTAHSNIDYNWLAIHAKCIYDTRNVGIGSYPNVKVLGEKI